MIYKMLDTGKDRPVSLSISFERIGDEIMICMEDSDSELYGGVMTVSMEDWDIMVRNVKRG